MADIQLDAYIDRSETKVSEYRYIPQHTSIGGNLSNDNYHVALLGVSSDTDIIRQELYQLAHNFKNIKIADLGNIKNGKGPKDKLYALKEVVAQLVANGTTPIIFGGTQNTLLPLHKALAEIAGKQRITLIDPMIDLYETEEEERSYLFSLLNNDKVEELRILGLQNYLCSNWQTDTLQKSNVNSKRLGEIIGQLSICEPIFRDTDLFNLSFSALRQSEVTNHPFPMPNGLNGFEACQLAQYAGLSDSTLVYDITDIPVESDTHHNMTARATAALAAQVIWHILTGIDNRFGDYPKRSEKSYERFLAIPEVEGDEPKVFYHNKANGRWWMEIPTLEGTRIYACTKEDYKQACAHAIPDIWMRHYMR